MFGIINMTSSIKKNTALLKIMPFHPKYQEYRDDVISL